MAKITNQAEHISLTQALPLISNRLIIRSKQLHLDFEKDHPIGYHNFTHVATATSAASLLVDTVTKDENEDPLNLKQHLGRYNAENQTNYNLDDFCHICQIAFSLHDTGNICQVNKFGQPKYLPFYTATGAEPRSQSNATNFLNFDQDFRNVASQHQNHLLFFVNYLIGHTVYQEIDLDQPFATFVKVCDQLSIVTLPPKKIINQQKGLITEMTTENPVWRLENPHQFFNFVHYRFPILVPNDQTRQAIYNIWQVSMPPYLFNLPDPP